MSKTYHDEYAADRAMMAAVRTVLSETPQLDFGPAARAGLEERLARIPMAEEVAYEEGTLGGVKGWWCRPRVAVSGAVLLYLHGGAYVLGSAHGYRGVVGQLVARCGVAAFIAEYGLAPERPFPGGLDDAEAAYHALAEHDASRILLVGDSAGGGLVLALLSRLLQDDSVRPPVGVVLLSPWTDLTLSGESMQTRAEADPSLSGRRLATAVTVYLGERDARHPEASPLFADLTGAPPVLIEVGEDEVLLDDSLRLAEQLEDRGVAVELHVWKGMIHVFPGNLAILQAAREAMDQMGRFIRERLGFGLTG